MLVAAVVTVLMLCANAVGRQQGNQTGMVSCAQTAPVEMTNLMPYDAGVGTVSGVQSEEEDKVRQVARDFVKQKFPGSKFDGVSALPLWPEHLYIAGVDTTKDGDRQTVDLLVRSYTRRNGSTYWLPTLLSGEEAAKIRLQMAERR